MKFLDSNLKKQLVRFVFAGFVNTGVDWGSYFLLTRFFGVKSEFLAKIGGVFAGMLVAYTQNSLFVFREQFSEGIGKRQEVLSRLFYVLFGFVKMVGTYSLGMSLNVLVFHTLRQWSFAEIVSLAAATAFSLVFNFVFTRLLVFKH